MATRGDKQTETGTTATGGETRGGGTAVQPREAEGRGRRRGFGPAALTGTGLMRPGLPPSPWELMGRMSEELSQLFESFGGMGTPTAARGGQAVAAPGTRGRGLAEAGAVAPLLLIPQIEVEQRDDALVVRADLPGINPDDIDVTVENGMLVISGERREQRREEREGFVRTEVAYGTFYRTIPLPDGADENNISAVVRNGVLEVVVPVAATETGRRVQVQSGEGSGAVRSGGAERGAATERGGTERGGGTGRGGGGDGNA